MNNPWLLIIVLAAVTYLSRLLGVTVMAGRSLSPSLRRYFNYVPTAIIVALIMKQIFVPSNGQLTLSLPVLAACLAGALSIKFVKKFLPSVVIGIVIGLLVRYLL
ncbi:AzlD domain-containing protein [Sporolactobacillus terrae]|uniref:AzlD domain-containing protein n=1 Tax=Sporolactobacillus terrae TaxID=269673 RepID=A0ABX5Q485_9BACL|nr:AzlD domain-containing protein [Sporolactobacillus terrae]QAA21455.1 AzlD domain-containing protein [Sporolactobacillus terrae]QAA24427.1 AzlD domain-containing protein [Sporolactobacillus terrae]UAK16255.1 AzlD domain-containing protein [Sporolactobacillus terrae]